jgi:hypothetical protein
MFTVPVTTVPPVGSWWSATSALKVFGTIKLRKKMKRVKL